MDAYTAALLLNDPDVLAPFFTADARLSEPGMEDVEGAAAIRGFMASLADAGIRVTDVGVDTDAVHVAGVNAFEFGSFVESYRDGQGVEQTVRGRYAIHWRRGPEARWRIRRFLLNHLPGDTPGPATAEATPAGP
jgi:ketosteroid isomerase-like protein